MESGLNKLTADSRRLPQTFCSDDLSEQKLHSLREGNSILYGYQRRYVCDKWCSV